MHVRAGLARLATFLSHRFLTDRFTPREFVPPVRAREFVPGRFAPREFVPGRFAAWGLVTHGFPVPGFVRHRFPARRFLRRALAVAAGTALATAGLTAVPAAPHAAAATSTDAVTVNATSGLGTIPPGAIGLNTAVYDGDMNDAPIPGLLKAAGIDALRYPGGSYSDIYNWQTSTATDSGYVAPDTSFSDFMDTARSAGAQPIITVNYGTGTPALAAAWVQNADVTNSYGIKYWEVGNEVYGNGTYGANWETDSHCDTSLNGTPVTVGSEPSQTYNCGPAEYAANVQAVPLRDARRGRRTPRYARC